MIRKVCVVVLAALALAPAAPAQTAAWHFHWQPGQVLVYHVEQTTVQTETLSGGKVEARERLVLTKRWQVLAVDAAGVATLQMSVTAMRREMTTPGGDVLFFDSAEPDKSDPQLREQMAKFLNQSLAVLRIDAQGKVVEVKESKFGPASKFESDLPFAITLPDGAPKVGQAWERAYKVTLDPPQGAGEKFDAVQHCTCKAMSGPLATVGVAATIQNLPAAAADQAPLLASQPEGEVLIDVQAGLLKSVNLHVDKELKDHQGAGSSFHLESTYIEQYAGDK